MFDIIMRLKILQSPEIAIYPLSNSTSHQATFGVTGYHCFREVLGTRRS
jgi:hypothetical protein